MRLGGTPPTSESALQVAANSYFCKIVIGGLAADIPAEVFLGKLDDYGIWNRALTSTEISNLYNANDCKNQVVFSSPFDDVSSGTYLKSASNANGKITATNKIVGSANITYQAKLIELNNGFKANLGTIFRAEVGGCN